MNCKEVIRQMSEFIDGDLDECRCDSVKSHLEECPACRGVFDTFRTTIDLSKKLLRTQIPEDIRSRLREKLKDEYQKFVL
jgi:anti-sigma factor (TIGR02949 family)